MLGGRRHRSRSARGRCESSRFATTRQARRPCWSSKKCPVWTYAASSRRA